MAPLMNEAAILLAYESEMNQRILDDIEDEDEDKSIQPIKPYADPHRPLNRN